MAQRRQHEKQTMQLLELPDDLLLRILGQLPFTQRLRVAEVCRRLRALTAAPSELWREVDADVRLRGLLEEDGDGGAEVALDRGQQAQLACFRRWLEPRAPALEALRFHAAYLGNPSRMLSLATILPPLGTCTALARVTVQWDGPFSIFVPPSASGCPEPLLALRSLALVGCDVVIPRRSSPRWRRPPALQEFMLINGSLRGEAAAAAAADGAADGAAGSSSLNSAWLPPSLTSMSLSNCLHGIAYMPGVLEHLPRLRCLAIDRNDIFGGFGPLASLSDHLQELNLSGCPLGEAGVPTQLSCLRQLRILYMHELFGLRAPADEEWDTLKPLSGLVFLSISNNWLDSFPPAVAAMTQLQCLHYENNMCALPADAPLLRGLRELVLSWHTAFASAAALRAAPQLSRLVLAHDSVADPMEDQGLGPAGGAAAAEGLLAALAAMPALAHLDDFFPDDGDGQLAAVTPQTAAVMWQLGRRCPRLQLSTLPNANAAGWTLDSLLAGLAHNIGMTVLPA